MNVPSQTPVATNSLISVLSEECGLTKIDQNEVLKMFESKLVPVQVEVNDDWLLDFANNKALSYGTLFSDEIQKITSAFSSQVDVLNLYAEHYVNEMKKLLDTQAKRRTVAQNEVTTKVALVRSLFENIYNHLKALLVQSLKKCFDTENLPLPVGFPNITTDFGQTQHFYTNSQQSVVENTPQFTQATQNTFQFTQQMTQDTNFVNQFETQESFVAQPMFKNGRNYLDKRSKAILKKWFNEHYAYPYPSDEEKEVMAAQCGITMKQLNTWFSNYRSRSKKRAQRTN
ncbi:homeobox protein knotted-1, putative [Entamoeba invadens IP1]|uniref:Homeobox protein knotted-1, putative n=1 Tax=Entamoeba invadens IP1 TaxID=370355 RepID=A0A0A1U3X2_ENTIV|nr:homeobox protein knotted-1, putative [Entamoeba invadens IP1]ELP88861.1 homeobox protein knotted-1, putative [Entamoeba invadens IP1]|eukprot:XP_004255632.1 homeobox protein knotted-1, putative [Entamoeba invadens IP1]